MTNLKILLAAYNNISSIGKIDKLEELSILDVTQNPITDTTVLEQLAENNDIYIRCDIPMDKRLPGLTEQDKIEIIQEVVRQNINGNLAPGTEAMLRFYDKYILSTRDIKKEWIAPLTDLNVVCMTPKEMRRVTSEFGDVLKLEVKCFETQEDVVKVDLECYWVNNTSAMNGGFAEFEVKKIDGKWVIEIFLFLFIYILK